MEFRDLTTDVADRALLRRFYERQYVVEFPDLDERESLQNIEHYLELRERGWYGPNHYHVGLLLEHGEPIGGVIADYLAEPETGVLEFLVVASHRRDAGLGTRLLEWVETQLQADAARVNRRLDGIIAELNDPFKLPGHDSLDPFARLRIWGQWGYARLDLPYVQPALSRHQQSVRHLLLAFKPLGARCSTLASDHVRSIIHEYIRWAMRVPQPADCAEYVQMAQYLDDHPSIAAHPLRRYIGEDLARPLHCHDIRGHDDPDLDATLAVYAQAFPPGPTAADVREFRRAVLKRLQDVENGTYHLWALRRTASDAVDGMTSFFALPRTGFGGYIALGSTLRGTGRLSLILARIERQLVEDRTGARGWYIECGRNSPALEVFRRAGFREVAVDYRQPALGSCAQPDAAAVPLALLFKFFGAGYSVPVLPISEFCRDLAEIQRVVYGVRDPEKQPLYRTLADDAARSGTHVAFR